jgi:hypothetical protein
MRCPKTQALHFPRQKPRRSRAGQNARGRCTITASAGTVFNKRVTMRTHSARCVLNFRVGCPVAIATAAHLPKYATVVRTAVISTGFAATVVRTAVISTGFAATAGRTAVFSKKKKRDSVACTAAAVHRLSTHRALLIVTCLLFVYGRRSTTPHHALDHRSRRRLRPRRRRLG